MPVESPTQYGLPSRQPLIAAVSAEPASGRSSSSGAAVRHPLQPTPTLRVRKSTEPEPRQCRPTRSNTPGAATAANDRPCSGMSRAATVTSAWATAGAARAAAMTARRSFMGGCGGSRVPKAAFVLKGGDPSLIESLRDEDLLFAGTFARRSVPRACLSGRSGTTAGACDPFRQGDGDQPGDAGLSLPSAL